MYQWNYLVYSRVINVIILYIRDVSMKLLGIFESYQCGYIVYSICINGITWYIRELSM